MLELAAGRLQDKSSNVRKAAVQLLTTLLQSNPFAAKLGTAELEGKLVEEERKLAALCPEEARDPVESWADMAAQVEEGLGRMEEEQVPVWEGATADEVADRVAGLLEKKAVGKAMALAEAARTTFPGELFGEMEMEEDRERDGEGEGGEEGQGEGEGEGEARVVEARLRRLRLIFLRARRLPEASQELSQEARDQEMVDRQRMLVGYLQDSVKFSRTIFKALPVVAMLLGSKQSTDILEAIDFFVSAFEFGVQGSMLGVRRMLALIWSGEATIREAVVAAYKRLYIEVEGRGSERAASAATARNLIALVSGANLGELTSMEKLVSELVTSRDLTKGVVTVLWEYFTFALPDSDMEKCRDAVLLLGMCGLGEVSIIAANVQVVVDHGLGERAMQDFRLARNSCEALLRLVPAKLKQDDPSTPVKYPREHAVFQRLWALVTEGMWQERDPHWMPMAKEALTLVFKLGNQPDSLAGDMVKAVCARIQSEQAQLPGEIGEELRVRTFLLNRLCFLAGHVALCMLIYLDVDVFTELKRRQWMRDLQKEKDAKMKEKEKKQARRASLAPRHTAMGTPRNPGEAPEDEDMGCVGAEADDMEAEFIRRVCDKELLGPGHLLGCLAPLIVTVCANPTR